MTPRLEVVCCSADDVAGAQALGVHRAELCADITHGGLTPSMGVMITARMANILPIVAMIRPRPGGFCYSETEFDAMRHDAEAMLTCGADGVVFGILRADGTIDMDRCAQLCDMARERETVFHRAFDAVSDPFTALEQLIDLGFTRILTSGQEATAIEGADTIRQLREKAAGRIEILAGGTLRPHNVRAFMDRSRCNLIHMSAFRECSDETPAGVAGPGSDPYLALDHDTIKQMLGEMCVATVDDNVVVD